MSNNENKEVPDFKLAVLAGPIHHGGKWDDCCLRDQIKTRCLCSLTSDIVLCARHEWDFVCCKSLSIRDYKAL